ncbi:hypothetical protein ES705_34771 [subsurface metagenome]
MAVISLTSGILRSNSSIFLVTESVTCSRAPVGMLTFIINSPWSILGMNSLRVVERKRKLIANKARTTIVIRDL